MLAMMLTGLSQMRMTEVPDPEIKCSTDVLIKMATVGVCGSDIHYYLTGRIGSQIVSYPFTVGHEGAGTVIAVGKEVTHVKPGDRVAIEPAMPCFVCDQCLAGRHHTCRRLKFLGCPGQAEGCLSEYIVMPETSCLPLPANLSYTDGALSEPLAIGVYAVKLSIPMAGAKIGILGSGPIGMSVMLAAKAAGCSVIYMTDKLDARLKRVKDAGASWIGNTTVMDVTGEISRAEPLLLDAVFECCGQQEAMDQAIELLKPGGKLMVVGIPEFDHWRFQADLARRKELCIQHVRRQVNCAEQTLNELATRQMDASQMATHRFPFNRTHEAFEWVAGYRDGVMKAMIDF